LPRPAEPGHFNAERAALNVCITAGQALEENAQSRLEVKKFIFDRLFLYRSWYA
jgi:hypothetical protein